MGVGDIFCFIVNPLYVESPFFCVVVANKSDVTVANKVGWGICRQYVCRQYV